MAAMGNVGLWRPVRLIALVDDRALRFVFPEPAAGERFHRGLARRLEAVRLIAAFTEGEVDRPHPGLGMGAS